MSDPRKHYVCKKCGRPVSDKWGHDTPCDYCTMKEFIEKQNKSKGIV